MTDADSPEQTRERDQEAADALPFVDSSAEVERAASVHHRPPARRHGSSIPEGGS